MGVSGLYDYLRGNFSECFVGVPPCENLLIDMNSLLHNAVRHAASEAAAIHALIYNLNMLTQQYAPTHSITLAIDGPAPMAKLHEQRHRRLKSSQRLASSSSSSSSSVSTNAVTVGTSFLRDIDAALRSWACALSSPPGVRVVVDPSCHDGEGEVKLFQHIGSASQRDLESQRFLVLGGDADLILLALASAARHVFVCDPSGQQGGRSGGKGGKGGGGKGGGGKGGGGKGVGGKGVGGKGGKGGKGGGGWAGVGWGRG